MEKNKRIAIGIENYKEFIDKDFYYVDKTLLIRDLLNLGGKVTLFTRQIGRASCRERVLAGV